MNKASATFTLHTNNCTSTRDPNVYTFSHLNIKEILGDMLYKYSRFKMVVNAEIGYTSNSGQIFFLKLSGFDWINSYDFRRRVKSDPYIILPINTTTRFNQLPSNNGVMFSRPSNNTVNFEISFASRDTYMTAGSLNITECFFIITIYGVDDEIPRDIISATNMMIKESATFTLHNRSVSSDRGVIFTFNNLNIREILGPMFNKYSRFKLVLNAQGGYYYISPDTVTMNGITFTPRGGANEPFFLKLSGFDWINSYDFRTEVKSVPYIMFPTISNHRQQINIFQSNNGFMFQKPSNGLVNFEMWYQNRDLWNSSTYLMAEHLFIFSIYGLD